MAWLKTSFIKMQLKKKFAYFCDTQHFKITQITNKNIQDILDFLNF